jgi:hypothetical protein
MGFSSSDKKNATMGTSSRPMTALTIAILRAVEMERSGPVEKNAMMGTTITMTSA